MRKKISEEERRKLIPFRDAYTQTKKTVNAENIPGMFVLTNRARDLITAENERVSQSRNRVGSRIVLKGLKI